MIHDAYTREADEKARLTKVRSMLQLVAKTADKLGCRLEILRGDEVRLVAVMPQKEVQFAKFANLEEAAAWCRKW